MKYKGWTIQEAYYPGWYEAFADDCDTQGLYAKGLDQIKIEIDECETKS